MTGLIAAAALLVTVVAFVSAAAALVATRRTAVALPVLLDLLLAAGLLRLALQPSPTQLAGTALLVLVKRLASSGIRHAAGARSTRPSPLRP